MKYNVCQVPFIILEKSEKSVFVPHSSQFVETIRLNRKPFHLVGSAMGGNVAGVYAACYPSEICSMTLICPDGQLLCMCLTISESVDYTLRSFGGCSL